MRYSDTHFEGSDTVNLEKKIELNKLLKRRQHADVSLQKGLNLPFCYYWHVLDNAITYTIVFPSSQ